VLGTVRGARLAKEQIESWRAGMLREDGADDPDGRRKSANTANRVLKISRLRSIMPLRAKRTPCARIPHGGASSK
jgi:hypothetical protein